MSSGCGCAGKQVLEAATPTRGDLATAVARERFPTPTGSCATGGLERVAIRALLTDRAELVAEVEKLREALRWALSTWSEMEATNDDPIPPHGCRFYRGECDCSFHNEFVDAWNLAGLPWSEEDEETPDDR
jgi:hypothetical protein